MADAQVARPRFPPQIPFIIGNEACERFSFYGMRNILTVFLVDYLLLHEAPEARQISSQSTFHLFVMGVYFFPLLGGYVADRYFGKYRTIFWMSLLYCVGQGMLAAFTHTRYGFYGGMFLVALGSGGIKPCVSAFVGDQFDESNKSLVKKVFAVFYWSINLGSFFASAFIPKTLKLYGPAVAFGIPGILMAVATLVFWMGRRRYTELPPTGVNPHSFTKVIASAFRTPRPAGAKHWLDGARAHHPEDAVEGAKAVFRVLTVFAPIPFFWMLFDQKASAWVLQAKTMNLQVGSWTFEPSQMQLVNPALVMILIPFTAGILYPALERAGIPLKPLWRMVIGLFSAAFSFVLVALIQVQLDGGNQLSVLWQAAPYVALTMGEVLVSTTGLEFAYTQAPPQMKGTVQSFWNLTVAAGNLGVVTIKQLNFLHGAASPLFYAGLASLAGVALALIARKYVVRDWFQAASTAAGASPTARPGSSAAA